MGGESLLMLVRVLVSLAGKVGAKGILAGTDAAETARTITLQDVKDRAITEGEKESVLR